ncbi:MAG: SGNH/GDSL hydrolase family protein [Cyanobacteria bacterium P01_C01_bin.38]
MSETILLQNSDSIINNFVNSFFNIKLPQVIQPQFDGLYVFGDSLSDNGNVFIGQNYVRDNLNPNFEIAPSPPYFPGRASNGFVWTDYLAQELGFDLKPVLEFAQTAPVSENSNGEYEINSSFGGNTATQSTNFAFGGAKLVNDVSDPGSLFTPSISTQVDWFLKDLEVKQIEASEDALYVIGGGPNDYVFDDFTDPTEPVMVVTDVITDLYDAGARYFLVPNIPDLGGTPIGRSLSDEQTAFLTDISKRHDDLLETNLRNLERDLPDIEIETVDLSGLNVDIANDPEAFGFTNITDSYLIREGANFSTAGDNPSEYLFFDEIHPTTVGHLLIADIAVEATQDLGVSTIQLDSIRDIFDSILASSSFDNYIKFESEIVTEELFV